MTPQKFQYKNEETPAKDIMHQTSITAAVIDFVKVGLKLLILSFVFFMNTDANNENANNKIGVAFASPGIM